MKWEPVDSTPIEVPLQGAAAYIYPPPELEGPWLIRITLDHASVEATVTPAKDLFRHALLELGMRLS
jgi:hypothetical protein